MRGVRFCPPPPDLENYWAPISTQKTSFDAPWRELLNMPKNWISTKVGLGGKTAKFRVFFEWSLCPMLLSLFCHLSMFSTDFDGNKGFWASKMQIFKITGDHGRTQFSIENVGSIAIDNSSTVVTSERAQGTERVLSYLREKSEYSRPGPARPDPAPSRYLKPYISGTACLIDKRSSLMNTTWM